ncbi:MAG: hypothetical protein JWR44_3756 [Hymenobacter sp.]|jgi:hypothetical protein|nr:hypothetical protein [Hymenobacter sp.]
MEKLQTLLWILFGIGVFVFRMVKKMQETSTRESRERPQQPGGTVPGLPTATFQELLQQMQSRNAPVAAARPDNKPPITPALESKRTLGGRPMPREAARPARSQERPVGRPLSLEAPATSRPINAPAPPARRSSAMPRASVKSPLETALPAPVAASVNGTVRRWLGQPDTLRAAFVLSEIWKRKFD